MLQFSMSSTVVGLKKYLFVRALFLNSMTDCFVVGVIGCSLL